MLPTEFLATPHTKNDEGLFTSQGHDLDSSLGQQDRAEVFAFSSMVEGQLLSAMVRFPRM
jgi:hypothetical protein